MRLEYAGPIGSGTVRKYGLIGGGVTLLEEVCLCLGGLWWSLPMLRLHAVLKRPLYRYLQKPDPALAALRSKYRTQTFLYRIMSAWRLP